MKKIIVSVLLGAMLVCGCTACGTTDSNTGSTKQETTATAPASEDSEAGQESEADEMSKESDESFEYHVMSDGTAEIIDYDGDSTEIIIPSEIDGYMVTAIGLVDEGWDNDVTGGFIHGNTDVEKVTISNTVKIIGGYSFWGCTNLKEVELGSEVIEIHEYAFSSIAIEEINIPDEVTFLGECAISGCANLKEVQLPAGLTTIETGNFVACADGFTITAPAGSAAETYASECGYTFVAE